MLKKTLHFFDKLEDRVRNRLSHTPLLYALVAGVGIVLFWRGVWHTADNFLFMSGPVSLVLGSIMLLITGVFVSAFVGNRAIITGLKGEKRLSEKTMEEVALEEAKIKDVEKTLVTIEKDLEEIKNELHHQNK